MSKHLWKVYTLSIVLLFQLIFINYAEAGFYDWLVSKDRSDEILVQSSNDHRTSFDHFYGWTKSIEESPSEDAQVESYRVVHETYRQVTAYNVGDPYQTDSTPCIGAYSKVNLCEEIKKVVAVCAANFVPLNTTLRIFTDDDQSFECIVWDRMNSRYTKRVDIAMSLSEKTQAKQFGLKQWKVQILEDELSL